MTRVLIVEDEAPIGEGLVALFDAQGFATTLAPDGVAATRAIEEGGLDLVILDLMIPPPNGLALLGGSRPTQRLP